MDDVACMTVLTASVVSISLAAASFLAEKPRQGVPVAQECPQSSSGQVLHPPMVPRHG